MGVRELEPDCGAAGGRFSRIGVWSRRGINVKRRGQARSCPITRYPVTANRGANNRRKGLIALDSAPTAGPIMAAYWVAATAVRGDGVRYWAPSSEGGTGEKRRT